MQLPAEEEYSPGLDDGDRESAPCPAEPVPQVSESQLSSHDSPDEQRPREVIIIHSDSDSEEEEEEEEGDQVGLTWKPSS